MYLTFYSYTFFVLNFILEHEEHVSSNFIAASESKNSRETKKIIVRPKKEVPVESEIDVSKLRQSSESSGSETSPDTRWSEVGHAPNLKSYSQTTFSDLDSDDAFGDADRTHDHFMQI